MSKAWRDTLWQLAAVALAGLLGWLLVRGSGVPDSPAAVESALRQLHPAEVESITIFPFGAGSTRPMQLRTATQVAWLLAALHQLPTRPAPAPSPDALLAATLTVRLTAPAVAARHLRHRELTFRLVGSGPAAVAQRAGSPQAYQAAVLGRQVQHLRDSLATFH